MARSKLLPLAEGQLEIMEILWERGEATVGEVWKSCPHAAGSPATRCKRCCNGSRIKAGCTAGRTTCAHRFRAAVPRRATLRDLLQRFVDVVFAGSTEGLLASLLDRRKVSPEEAARIRALIDQAERKRP